MSEVVPNQNPVTELDGHELGPIIAQSSRSLVCESVQKEKGEIVALKLVDPSAREQGSGTLAFLGSAQRAAGLRHPNVVQLLRCGADEGIGFVAMELIDGPSLQSVLEEEGSLPPQDVARLLSQGLSALAAAEEMGIRHGRLKPSHCLLTPDRDLKLIGYISSGLEEDDEGLPFYMSPEQATGASPPDHRSDIYSLGATFYHALCGTPPFVADNLVRLKLNIELQPLPPPTEWDPSLPVGLSNVLVKMLARDPNQRYQSAADALAALDAHAAAGGDDQSRPHAPSLPEDIVVPPEMQDEMSAATQEIIFDDDMRPDEAETAEAITQPMSVDALTEELEPEPAELGSTDAVQPARDDGLVVEEEEKDIATPVPPAAVGAEPAKGQLAARKERTACLAVMWVGILVMVCGSAAYFYFLKLREPAGGKPGLQSGGQQCSAALNEAMAIRSQRPEDFGGAISALQNVIDKYPDTVEAVEAKKNIDRLNAGLQDMLEKEWVGVSAEALPLMNGGRHKECDQVLREFQKKCIGSGVQDDVVRFLRDLEDRNLALVGNLYEKASKLHPRKDREAIEELLRSMEERAVTANLHHARAEAEKFRDCFLSDVGIAEGQVADLADRLYRDYRKEMQFAARVNDHQGALQEVDKFAAVVDRHSRDAQAEGDRSVWQKCLKWVEADRRSLETVSRRWNAGIRKWFEQRKGEPTQIGTIQGILERYENGRFFLRCGMEVLTEPSGMVPADQVIRLAFPERDVPIGEEIIEKGWWLLYQEDIAGARRAEENARALRADTRDLKEAIQRWHYSGWLLESLFTGKGSTGPGGEVQLYYDFSSSAQASDWFAVETEFHVVRKAMYPMGQMGDHGCLIQSQLPVVGPAELSMDVTFADAESVLRVGFMRPEGRYREYHYVELSPGRVGHWIGTHITRTGGNADKPLAIERLPVGKKQRVTLKWTRDNILTLCVEQRQVYVYQYTGDGAWMAVIGNREGKVVLDDILLIGNPDPNWIASQQPALWLAYEKRKREDWVPLFNRENLDGWRCFGEGEWEVVEGTLRGNGINPTLEIGEPAWHNYIVTAKVRIETGATVRLYVRRDPGGDGTADARQFVFGCGAYVDCGIYKDKTYDWFKSRDMVGAWHTHWHDLAASARADFYDIFIDGRLYYRFQDTERRCRSGKLAIYSHQGSSWKDIRIKLLR